MCAGLLAQICASSNNSRDVSNVRSFQLCLAQHTMARRVRLTVVLRELFMSKKLFLSSFLASVCVSVVYWTQFYLDHRAHAGDRNNSHVTRYMKIEQGLSTEEKLLQAINSLPFKAMRPSSLLLEDFYFTQTSAIFVDYNNSLLHAPECGSSEFLLILVPSHPRSADDRRAIRETWGSVARKTSWPWKGAGYRVRLVFVLGVSEANPYTAQGQSSNPSLVFSTSRSTTRAHSDGRSKITSTKNKRQHDNSYRSDDQPKQIKYATNITRGSGKQGILDTASTSEMKDAVADTIDSNEVVSNKQSKTCQDELLPEMFSFHDILQFDMLDTYANLTRKMILALRWLVQSCPAATFILKSDPDVFVHIPLVITFLKHYGENNSIYGHIYPNSDVQRRGKWAVSYTDLPISKYPIYAAGNAYIMSKDAAATVVHLAPHFPYVLVEDAFITGILASVAGVDRVHMAGFTKWTEMKPDPCEFVKDRKYTGNNFTKYDHRLFWREIIDNGNYRCDR